MKEFNGSYIKFDGNENMSLNAPDGYENLALQELKVFKKIAQLEKKQLNEQMRSIRNEASSDRITQGPASSGFGALFFRGTKLGSFFRTAGVVSRANSRKSLVNQLAPYETKKRIIEQILIGCDRFEIKLKQVLLTA